LAFQFPYAIPGVSVSTFLREAYRALHGDKLLLKDYQTLQNQALDSVGLDLSFASRSLNDGFSGGERKRLEIAQFVLLRPKLAILDEIDSGLDLDAINKIADLINLTRKLNSEMSIILITHSTKFIDLLNVDQVHLMRDGSIIERGGASLIKKIERSGYE